jgi:hypothetical protein
MERGIGKSPVCQLAAISSLDSGWNRACQLGCATGLGRRGGWDRGLGGGRLLVDPVFVDVQPRHLKVLGLEAADHPCRTARRPTARAPMAPAPTAAAPTRTAARSTGSTGLVDLGAAVQSKIEPAPRGGARVSTLLTHRGCVCRTAAHGPAYLRLNAAGCADDNAPSTDRSSVVVGLASVSRRHECASRIAVSRRSGESRPP